MVDTPLSHLLPDQLDPGQKELLCRYHVKERKAIIETYCIKQGHFELLIRQIQWKKLNRETKILCILDKNKEYDG
jgi:hypothetical protein